MVAIVGNATLLYAKEIAIRFYLPYMDTLCGVSFTPLGLLIIVLG